MNGGSLMEYKPLTVTAVGHHCVSSGHTISTVRPKGRDDYQLLYINSGKVRFYFNGQEHALSQNNMVLYRPGEPQIYYQETMDKPEIYWVHFTGSDVEQMLDSYQIPKDQNTFYVGTKPDFPWLYNQMIQELELKRVNFDNALVLNLQQIFLSINRYLQERSNTDTEMSMLIEYATQYFHENFNQNIVIEDYAREHNVTPHWFSQNFKKITKSTPMQYIISLRIKSAMNLLENTDYSIVQVAEAVGYDNPLYFSRIFKKNTGMSPSDYKNRKYNTQ